MTKDYPSHAVDPEVEALLDQIAGNDVHSDDRYEVVSAILRTAREWEGVIDPNHVRAYLEDVATRGVIGAVYHALCAADIIRPIGWTINTDRDGRNGGKPIRLYEMVSRD